MAGGQKATDEAQQCETTHNVLGQHGQEDGIRCGETEVHGWIIAAFFAGDGCIGRTGHVRVCGE